MKRRARVLTVLAAFVLPLLAACDASVYSLPLPGGTDTGARPDHRHREVPRRARPGAAVDGEGQRRQRRQGDRRPPGRRGRGGDPRASQGREAARQRDRRAPPDQSARREVRLARAARVGRQLRAPGRRRRDPAGEVRPQPGGRGGPGCAEPAAQRRRRGSAQDHHQRDQQRARGPGGLGDVGAEPGASADEAARRQQGRHREGHRGAEPALDRDGQAPRHHRRGPRRAAQRPRLARQAARRPRADAGRPRRAQRRRRPGDPGVEGRHRRQPRAARPRAHPAGRRGRRLRQRLPRLPDLPVRRRGGRPRPAGGSQPAHGRLHEPVDPARGRPVRRRTHRAPAVAAVAAHGAPDAAHDPAVAPDPDPAADGHRPDQDRQRRAGLHRQRRPQQSRVPQGAGDRARDPRAPGGVQEARERRDRGLQGRQRRAAADGAHADEPAHARRPEHHPADGPRAGPGSRRRAGHLRRPRPDHGSADGPLRPRTGQPHGARPGGADPGARRGGAR